MDADILGHWELHIMSKGYNMDADILERQEPYIISKSYIDSKKGPRLKAMQRPKTGHSNG
jgi:hypothetical protein